MKRLEHDLGSILRTAMDLSKECDCYPTLEAVQERLNFSTERMNEALEFEPKPLGWHLATLDSEDRSANRGQDGLPFVVNGQLCGLLIIDRVDYKNPQPIRA